MQPLISPTKFISWISENVPSLEWNGTKVRVSEGWEVKIETVPFDASHKPRVPPQNLDVGFFNNVHLSLFFLSFSFSFFFFLKNDKFGMKSPENRGWRWQEIKVDSALFITTHLSGMCSHQFVQQSSFFRILNKTKIAVNFEWNCYLNKNKKNTREREREWEFMTGPASFETSYHPCVATHLCPLRPVTVCQTLMDWSVECSRMHSHHLPPPPTISYQLPPPPLFLKYRFPG